MTIQRLLCLVAALLLVPAVAAADDLSATLSGGGGSGIASIVTGSGSVSYAIVTNGIGTITGAEIRQGNSTFVNLDPAGGSASAAGAVNTAANLSALNDGAGSFSVRVTGTSGTLNGTLANAGEDDDPGPDPVPGTIGLSADAYTALERDGQVTVSAVRSGGDDGAVSVDVATAGGSATSGADFTAVATTLAWADGESGAKTVVVTIADDAEGEDEETFTVGLSNPTGGATLGTAAATVTIFDNDSPCVEDATTLCLDEGRFEVTATWATPQGGSGDGQAGGELTDDTGWFWFFNDQNVEVVVKALNACGVNDHYWLFAAGLTNVEVHLTVRDTESGLVQMYDDPQSTTFVTITDTAAFMSCP